ncbi:ACP S-malonyltransferase [Agaribacter flavus]|uniref:Malonyl CoA-acyl carrier protein transacylase n=1 Tax=Agaribacter flavus TaxID=1902781 RepID=A0ABV7FQH3_9ALTE
MTALACVFPGQGSQSLGMLADLAAEHKSVLTCFEEASDALNYNLWDLVQNGPVEKLNQTDITQPALLTASIAAYQVYIATNDRQPRYLAGHSLGEYTALVAAGVLSLTDAVKLVELRGQFMQQAVPAGTGAMYAIIGLDDAQIIEVCNKVSTDTGLVVSAVNFNSPGQVVIAGNSEAVEQAGTELKAAGAKRALPLAVSVPSHCELMKPAAERLEDYLSTIYFNTPEIEVVNNVDVAVCHSADEIKAALVRQLYKPVRWTETVTFLASQGVEEVVEVGPGKVLAGLNKRIDKTLILSSFN